MHRSGRDVIVTLEAQLTLRLGARVTASQAVLEQHSHGEGLPAVGVPDLVAFPQTNDEVAFILALCNDLRVRLRRLEPDPRWKASSRQSRAAFR